MPFTTLSQAIWPILDRAAAMGIELDRLLAGSGYTVEQLRAPNTRIPRPALLGILRTGMQLDDDPGAGFRLLDFVRPETFDVLEYAARSSDTFRDVLEIVNRYAPIFDDSASFTLEERGDVVFWRLDMDWPADVAPGVQQYVGMVLRTTGIRILGYPVPAEELWFSHPAPPNVADYQRFEVPVRFDAPCSGMLFRRETLSLPTKGADPALAGLLRRTAETELAKIERPENLAAQVAKILVAEIEREELSLERVARHLGITPDTLRRRLRSEQTSYRALLADARLQAARIYLSRRAVPLTEVAFRLGFRNSTSFFRWFKERTGQTPAAFRADANDGN